ncbi:hypothetical protein [Haloarchaeobius amylolyticus]|uniref:hypothetical protein n=1 Tax=Haloarchaeobius amylolyticus TaxID=1198296 RepID=UPI00227076F7|nr:hypothetical protein [Haloarchaeobius amylolyticus]
MVSDRLLRWRLAFVAVATVGCLVGVGVVAARVARLGPHGETFALVLVGVFVGALVLLLPLVVLGLYVDPGSWWRGWF